MTAGGSRPGSGRPKTHNKAVTIRIHPSQQEQLNSLVDALKDGRIDELKMLKAEYTDAVQICNDYVIANWGKSNYADKEMADKASQTVSVNFEKMIKIIESL